MELNKLLTTAEILNVVGSCNVDICRLDYDSRTVSQQSLFFALPGVQADGFDYIPQAIRNGAVAVICARVPENCPGHVCFVQVANVRLAMALIAAEFYGQPTVGVPVIGVTGTNGKTSITYLLEAILKQAGFRPAVFGTVEYRFESRSVSASHTTPESVELMRLMADYRKQGADALILEVSSHALEQHRVDGIDFDLTVFTNLTQDHLDYHLTLDSYFNSKKDCSLSCWEMARRSLTVTTPMGGACCVKTPTGHRSVGTVGRTSTPIRLISVVMVSEEPFFVEGKNWP